MAARSRSTGPAQSKTPARRAPRARWERPVYIGPTWKRRPSGAWVLPERTLGWQVLAWTASNLLLPDGPNAGQPWIYTNEQARFILWWFAVDEHGRFVYRYGMLRRVKGWGKDPVAATICATEFVGPCRFGGFAEARQEHPHIPGYVLDAGEPIAIPHPAPWVLLAAVSKDQTRNTMTLFPSLFTQDAIKEHRIDVGKEIIYARHGKARLEAVTSSPRALEGPRSSFTLKNETQHWLANNDGHAMSEVIGRNLTKSRDGAARALAISNAHRPGEDSDAEHDFEAWRAIEAGTSPAAGFLYDSVEAYEKIDLDDELQLRAGLRAARGDSIWLDEDRHIEEIYDDRNDRALSRRFYLNHVVAPEDRWIDPDAWDELADAREVKPKSRIVIGVDGARFEDALGIVATETATGYQWPLGVWERPENADDDYEHPMEEIDGVMVDAFARYDVWRVYIDPGSTLGNITPLVEKWQGRWGQKRVLPWYMNRLRATAIAVANYAAAVSTAALSHDGDEVFARHVKNAVRRLLQMHDDDGRPLYTISKDRPGSPRKIDAGAAGVLSWEAFGDCVAAGEDKPKKKRAAGFN